MKKYLDKLTIFVNTPGRELHSKMILTSLLLNYFLLALVLLVNPPFTIIPSILQIIELIYGFRIARRTGYLTLTQAIGTWAYPDRKLENYCKDMCAKDPIKYESLSKPIKLYLRSRL